MDRDWDEFKLRFEQIERSFFTTLAEKYPQLSKTDVRICALVRLNLSSKEIAGMLHITPESVNKSRYRLRKKLELPKEQDLDQFISSL